LDEQNDSRPVIIVHNQAIIETLPQQEGHNGNEQQSLNSHQKYSRLTVSSDVSHIDTTDSGLQK